MIISSCVHLPACAEKEIMKVGFQKEKKREICEMARKAKALVSKLDTLNLIHIIPRSHIEEEES